MNEWMDGWMNEWMDGWMDEWMDGWSTLRLTAATRDLPLGKSFLAWAMPQATKEAAMSVPGWKEEWWNEEWWKEE